MPNQLSPNTVEWVRNHPYPTCQSVQGINSMKDAVATYELVSHYLPSSYREQFFIQMSTIIPLSKNNQQSANIQTSMSHSQLISPKGHLSTQQSHSSSTKSISQSQHAKATVGVIAERWTIILETLKKAICQRDDQMAQEKVYYERQQRGMLKQNTFGSNSNQKDSKSNYRLIKPPSQVKDKLRNSSVNSVNGTQTAYKSQKSIFRLNLDDFEPNYLSKDIELLVRFIETVVRRIPQLIGDASSQTNSGANSNLDINSNLGTNMNSPYQKQSHLSSRKPTQQPQNHSVFVRTPSQKSSDLSRGNTSHETNQTQSQQQQQIQSTTIAPPRYTAMSPAPKGLPPIPPSRHITVDRRNMANLKSTCQTIGAQTTISQSQSRHFAEPSNWNEDSKDQSRDRRNMTPTSSRQNDKSSVNSQTDQRKVPHFDPKESIPVQKIGQVIKDISRSKQSNTKGTKKTVFTGSAQRPKAKSSTKQWLHFSCTNNYQHDSSLDSLQQPQIAPEPIAVAPYPPVRTVRRQPLFLIGDSQTKFSQKDRARVLSNKTYCHHSSALDVSQIPHMSHVNVFSIDEGDRDEGNNVKTSQERTVGSRGRFRSEMKISCDREWPVLTHTNPLVEQKRHEPSVKQPSVPFLAKSTTLQWLQTTFNLTPSNEHPHLVLAHLINKLFPPAVHSPQSQLVIKPAHLNQGSMSVYRKVVGYLMLQSKFAKDSLIQFGKDLQEKGVVREEVYWGVIDSLKAMWEKDKKVVVNCDTVKKSQQLSQQKTIQTKCGTEKTQTQSNGTKTTGPEQYSAQFVKQTYNWLYNDLGLYHSLSKCTFPNQVQNPLLNGHLMCIVLSRLKLSRCQGIASNPATQQQVETNWIHLRRALQMCGFEVLGRKLARNKRDYHFCMGLLGEIRQVKEGRQMNRGKGDKQIKIKIKNQQLKAQQDGNQSNDSLERHNNQHETRKQIKQTVSIATILAAHTKNSSNDICIQTNNSYNGKTNVSSNNRSLKGVKNYRSTKPMPQHEQPSQQPYSSKQIEDKPIYKNNQNDSLFSTAKSIAPFLNDICPKWNNFSKAMSLTPSRSSNNDAIQFAHGSQQLNTYRNSLSSRLVNLKKQIGSFTNHTSHPIQIPPLTLYAFNHLLPNLLPRLSRPTTNTVCQQNLMKAIKWVREKSFCRNEGRMSKDRRQSEFIGSNNQNNQSCSNLKSSVGVKRDGRKVKPSEGTYPSQPNKNIYYNVQPHLLQSDQTMRWKMVEDILGIIALTNLS